MCKLSSLRGVYSQEYQVNQYLEGLTTAVILAIGCDRKMFPKPFGTLTEVIELSDSYGRTELSRIRALRTGFDEKYPSRIRLKRVLNEPSVHFAESDAYPYAADV